MKRNLIFITVLTVLLGSGAAFSAAAFAGDKSSSQTKPIAAEAGPRATTAALPANQQAFLDQLLSQAKRQFGDQQIAQFSVDFSLEHLAQSPAAVTLIQDPTSYDQPQYWYDAQSATFVLDPTMPGSFSPNADHAFTLDDIDWSRVETRAGNATKLFGDDSMVLGTIFVRGGGGAGVNFIDVTYTDADGNPKPALTFGFDGSVQGVRCWNGVGCNWLDAAAR